jgi:DNA-binding IclR family transcriptional regulator
MDRVGSNKSATALRALYVLEILADAGRPLAVAEVASGIGADRSTAYRMLMTLLEAGYVIRDTTLKNYQLGYKLLSLTRSILNPNERTELINDCLRRIAERTKETVHYCVLDRDATVLVQRAKGTQLVAVDFQIGDRSPLHCTAIGKLLLAYQDARAAEAVINRGLRRVAAKTITDADRFRAELRKIRAQGFAFDDREFHDEMRCVAVPLFEKGGVVLAGISLSGPSSRFTLKKLDKLRLDAAEVSRELSRKLGGLD